MHATRADLGWQAKPALHEILVVDNSEFDRRRLTRAIARTPMAFTVTEVEDLEALGQALNAKRFDLILIDHALADGTGLDALQRCRASRSNRHALFVMVTGNDSSGLAVDALKGGFDEYLPKDDIDHSVLTGLLSRSDRKRRGAATLGASSPFLDFARRDAFASDATERDAASDPELRRAAEAVSNRQQNEGLGRAFKALFDAPEPGFEFKPSVD